MTAKCQDCCQFVLFQVIQKYTIFHFTHCKWSVRDKMSNKNWLRIDKPVTKKLATKTINNIKAHPFQRVLRRHKLFVRKKNQPLPYSTPIHFTTMCSVYKENRAKFKWNCTIFDSGPELITIIKQRAPLLKTSRVLLASNSIYRPPDFAPEHP